jgi:hypothetical protein
MDIAWIQVFVLTLSECVAPAGKSVCQEREFELQFLSQADCEFALQQLVSLKQESDNVIIDPDKASCSISARQSKVFASLDAVDDAVGGDTDWRAPQIEESQPTAERAAHQQRLAGLPACGEAAGVAPCKIGDIIIEEATGDPVEVWRRDDE